MTPHDWKSDTGHQLADARAEIERLKTIIEKLVFACKATFAQHGEWSDSTEAELCEYPFHGADREIKRALQAAETSKGATP